MQTEYSYQDDGDIASLVTVTEQGQVLLNFDYAYDGNGNCVRKSGEKYQNEYTYDRMNRLVGAVQDGEEEKYAYDLVGNRLKKESVQGTESYHYNVKNQLTHIHNGGNTLRYLYDKQGNLLEEKGKTRRKQYSYDAANRQVSIASAEADGAIGKLLQSNRYDGEGLRYETEENGKIIRFLFDWGELAQENREGEETRYVRGHSPIALNRGGKDRNYFVQDEMGSTLFLLDQNHEIRKTYRYDAFGNLLEETGDIANRLMYTGQMYDGAAVQYYLRARFYNPAIGRFMQEDTYRGDGLNLYAYCANNPVIYYDPSGCWKLCPDGKYEPTGTDQDKIRAYRDLDIEKLREMFNEIDPEKLREIFKETDLKKFLELFLADPEFIVDMPYVGQGMKNANSQGWMRDPKFFFTELSNAHPELFSVDNMQRIANGRAPIVDEQFLEYFPQYKDYIWQELIHHHIGGGGQAMPIPDGLHPGSGGIHNIEKLHGIWGRVDGTVFSGMLQNIKSITARTKNWINVRIK